MIGKGKVKSTEVVYDANCKFVANNRLSHIAFTDAKSALAAAIKTGWKRVHRGSFQVWQPAANGGIIVRTYATKIVSD